MPKLSPAGTCLSARDARPADHPAVRGVLLAAYQEYASVMPPPVFERYLADSSTSTAAAGRAGCWWPSTRVGSWGR